MNAALAERPVPLVKGFDARDERRISDLAETAAREEFDGIDPELMFWLRDDCQPHLIGVIVSAIRASVTAFDVDAKLAQDRAVQILRDMYIQQHRDAHRAEAERQVMEPSDED